MDNNVLTVGKPSSQLPLMFIKLRQVLDDAISELGTEERNAVLAEVEG